MTINWHAAARGCYDTQTEKQWQHATWENLPGKLMLLVSELDEFVRQANENPWATDVYTLSTPKGSWELQHNAAALELTDALIRNLADIYSLCGPDFAERMTVELQAINPRSWPPPCPEKLVWPIVGRAVRALEYWRKGDDKDVRICLELIALEIVRAWKIFAPIVQAGDLESYLEAKMEKNMSRPVKHGKLRDLG